jgi:hypothetical protein
MRFSKTEVFALAGALLAVAVLAIFAFRMVGFLGVGILGLLIGFIAVRVELEKDGLAEGAFASALYARHASVQNMSRWERAARRAEAGSLKRPLLIAKIVGAALISLGFGGWFYFG